MSSKSKLFVSVGAIVLTILSAAIAIAIVYASKNVTIQSSVNIYYTASGDISGTLAGYFKHSKGGTTGYQGLGSVELEDGSGSLDTTAIMNLQLSDEEDYVMFKFDFTNTDTKHAYTAVLIYEDNFTGGYSPDTNILISYGEDENTTSGNKTTTDYIDNKCDLGEIVVDENTFTPQSYYVKIKLESDDDDAEFSGSFIWQITLNN